MGNRLVDGTGRYPIQVKVVREVLLTKKRCRAPFTGPGDGNQHPTETMSYSIFFSPNKRGFNSMCKVFIDH